MPEQPSFVIDPPPRPSLAVAGTDARFPVRRVFCVGLNYAAHAREMDYDETLPPLFFMKSADTVDVAGGRIAYPPETADLHHEIELVIAIGKGGAEIPRETALDHVWGYGVGIDMTRRDRQMEAIGKGHPWDIGKSFDGAAPISPLRPVSATGHPASGRIWLAVDGDARQESDIDDLIWPPADIVARLSVPFPLHSGDIVFTGTPSGVGPVERGQTLSGGVDGIGELAVTIV